MPSGSYEPLKDLCDHWGSDSDAPGSRDLIAKRLLGAICDGAFFPAGLAVQAHALLLNIAGVSGDYSPNQPGVRFGDDGKLHLTPPSKLPDLEPVRDTVNLHSYFHPLLSGQAELASNLVEDVELFFDWLKNSVPDKRPPEVQLVLDHLAVDLAAFARWCEAQGWAVPLFATQSAQRVIPRAGTVLTGEAFKNPHWNLLQTLAWIYLGDPEVVEEAGQPGTGAIRSKMVEMPDGSSQLVELPDYPPSVTMLLRDSEEVVGRYSGLAEAVEALNSALASGLISAMGLRNNQGDLAPVPQEFWLDARFTHEPETASPIDLFRPGASRWFALRFPRDQILQVWPESEPWPSVYDGRDSSLAQAAEGSATPGGHVESLVGHEMQCADWLLDLMQQGDPDRAKAAFYEEAILRWQLSKRGFNRAWGLACMQAGDRAWNKPGRKSSRVNRFTN